MKQCQFGHLPCNNCSCRGTSCTLCYKAISRIQNRAIGAVLDSLCVTCKYENLGCKITCQFKSYTEHEMGLPLCANDLSNARLQAREISGAAPAIQARHKHSCRFELISSFGFLQSEFLHYQSAIEGFEEQCYQELLSSASSDHSFRR